MLEKLKEYFIKNPQFLGILFVICGVVLLLAAIKNWEWVFSGASYNTKKLEGISNMWGRGIARAAAGIGGAAVIIAGIVWFVIYTFY
jgi:hypothetical protein